MSNEIPGPCVDRDRFEIIGFQAVGSEWPGYVIRDAVERRRAGPVFETPEDAEFWLDLHLEARRRDPSIPPHPGDEGGPCRCDVCSNWVSGVQGGPEMSGERNQRRD